MNKICLISFIFTVSFCILEIPIEIKQELKPIKSFLKSFLPQQQNQNPQQVLGQYGDNIYFVGQIGIGTPKQDIEVQFDTTTSLTWVNSSKCKSNECNEWHSYNSQKSATYKSGLGSFSTNAGTRGALANDIISLAGKSISNFQFGQASKSNYYISGVVGLGMNEKFIYNDQILLKGYEQGQWDDLSFSLYHQNGRAAPQSHIVLGGVNPKFAKTEFTYFPLSNKRQWEIKFDAFKIKGNEIKLGNGYLDSTTANIVMPVQIYNQVLQQLGINEQQQYKLTDQQIQNLPTIEFIIGGKTFSLEKQYYSACQEANACYLLFQKSQIDSIVFGIPLFHKYYTHFDEGKKRIGIAEGVTIIQ